MSANLQSPIFNDETAAREALEAIRWPNGPTCPHCGNAEPETMPLIEGKKHSHRAGLRYCNACEGTFTVTVGTVFERSKIPLSKWWLAMHLMGASKKGISAHQLWRMLGFGSYRTAWFMAHRIREAMKDAGLDPIGGEGKTVEADETYIGKRETPRKLARGRIPKPTKSGKSGGAQKRVVFGLVERGGKTKLFHVQDATADTIREVLLHNVDRASALHTDESRLYVETGKEFADHRSVKHSAKEYVRYEADAVVHSNTIENVFSVFKRGMEGIYQHCGEAHLPRYLTEFEFRYNRRSALGWNDTDRVNDIARGIAGKRLMYR